MEVKDKLHHARIHLHSEIPTAIASLFVSAKKSGTSKGSCQRMGEQSKVLENIFNECTEEQQQRFISNLDDSYLVEELERRGFTITDKKQNSNDTNKI